MDGPEGPPGTFVPHVFRAAVQTGSVSQVNCGGRATPGVKMLLRKSQKAHESAAEKVSVLCNN